MLANNDVVTDDLRYIIELYEPLSNVDLEKLIAQDVTAALPLLVRLLACSSFVRRGQLFKLLYPIRKTNDVMQYMMARNSDEFDNFQLDLAQSSIFEAGNYLERLKIVAAEYVKLHELTHKPNQNPQSKLIKSELFDNQIYLNDISHCLFMLSFRALPSSEFNPLDMIETLIHVKEGVKYVIRLVINMPDRCHDVALHLINNGERIDETAGINEVSDQRAKTVRLLCIMNPPLTKTLRSITLQVCKMPSLTVMTTLDLLSSALYGYNKLLTREQSENAMDVDIDRSDKQISEALALLGERYDDAVAFLAGVFIGSDEAAKGWFTQYTKSAQQKRIDQGQPSILTKFRSQLASCMNILFQDLIDLNSSNEAIPVSNGTDVDKKPTKESLQASLLAGRELNKRLLRAKSTLRLFCALRGIGSLKLNQEESDILLNLITCRPPVNQTSVNFITTAICTILVCSTLVNNPKEERRAADWLKWIIKDSQFVDDDQTITGRPSISELLTLLITHFQNNQTSQIAELVCATLGIKLQIKPPFPKCKSLFIQEFLTDQAVAEHIAKIPVPKNATSISSEFIPVYLSYQGPIKDWIYQHWMLNTAFCPIQHWLSIEHYDPDAQPDEEIENGFQSNGQTDSIAAQLEAHYRTIESDPTSLFKTLNRILSLPDKEAWALVHPFISNWICILDIPLSQNPEMRKLIKQVTKLWWKLNSVCPKKLWVLTVNSLRRPQASINNVKPIDLTWDELTNDPLIVLRCDIRIYRCVDTLNILLHILCAFLAASRRSLQDKINEQPDKQKDGRNLEELRTTLVLAQTSAAIQILLEACLPSQAEQEVLLKRDQRKKLAKKDKILIDNYDAGVNCICGHLHQVFIADTNLAKLIHFQTYPSELLSLTSNHIPSMHICLDFIPELLSQPDLKKQVFVIELTSHLCEKYAITKSLNVAKLCFNVSYTLLQVLPSDRRALFFIPVLPALIRMSRVFPILREDAAIILSQIDQITLAHMASAPSRLSFGSSRPFDGVESLSWTEVKKVMQTSSSHEALYLCIRKSYLELCYESLTNSKMSPSGT